MRNKLIAMSILGSTIIFSMLLAITFSVAQTSRKHSDKVETKVVVDSNKAMLSTSRSSDIDIKSNDINLKGLQLLDSIKIIKWKMDSLKEKCKIKLSTIKAQQNVIISLPDSLTTKN